MPSQGLLSLLWGLPASRDNSSLSTLSSLKCTYDYFAVFKFHKALRIKLRHSGYAFPHFSVLHTHTHTHLLLHHTPPKTATWNHLWFLKVQQAALVFQIFSHIIPSSRKMLFPPPCHWRLTHFSKFSSSITKKPFLSFLIWYWCSCSVFILALLPLSQLCHSLQKCVFC